MAGGTSSSMSLPPPINSSIRNVRNKKVAKNALGQRQDVAWKHGTPVNDGSRNIKCNYCHSEYSGGAFRFKHHLAGTNSNVESCVSVPDEVRKQMWTIVHRLQSKLIKKRTLSEDIEVVDVEDGKRKKVESSGLANIFKRAITSQSTINDAFKKK
ncbi:unnamed protein product [Lathyrus sativus]|nr:unnamed protein product [Lathyrus sativus]